jgi:radical SAM superfamily enzyme YgiQ (UPF0313 family)
VTICLVTRHATASYIPLALMYLKASLVERGGCDATDVRLLEFRPEDDAGAIAEAILRENPDVVGLSCYVWNTIALLETASRIKAQRPDVRIVLGGPEVGPVASDVLERSPQVDIIVRSEGEIPLRDLIAALRSGMGTESVRGITFRRANEIVSTEDARIVSDLDELPSPHFARYADYTKRIICVETQRGCVFRCNFCFYNKDFSIRNRRFDLDRVKEELRFWLEQDIRKLYLMDPVFNLNAARTRELCRFVAEHNRNRVPLHGEIWAEFVDDEMAALMKAANFRSLEVGLQTTDTTALATTERRLKLQKFVDGIGHLKRHGLWHELQLIYGLPGETVASFKKSLNFAMSLDPPGLSVFPLLVLPGTELWRKAAQLELAFDPVPPYFARSHLTMSEADFLYGRRLILAVDQLEQSRTARLLARERGLTFVDVVDEWIEWDGKGAAVEAWTTWEPTYRPKTEALAGFVAHMCAEHHIPPLFYEKMAGLEFA